MPSASSPRPARIVILASGGGSNAEAIVRYFSDRSSAEVIAILSDRKHAGVHERAAGLGITSRFVGPRRRQHPGGLLQAILDYTPDVVVLAGYLRLIPEDVLRRFPERVINIHPALLPAYGGPGMYGRFVHEAVALAGDERSGMTIHLASARYDEGRVLFQAATPLQAGNTPTEIAARVLALEHRYYPRVLEAYLQHLSTGAHNPHRS